MLLRRLLVSAFALLACALFAGCWAVLGGDLAAPPVDASLPSDASPAPDAAQGDDARADARADADASTEHDAELGDASADADRMIEDASGAETDAPLSGFTLVFSPSLTVVTGGGTPLAFSVAAPAGSSGNVTVSVKGLPSGVSVAPVVLDAGASGTLSFVASSQATQVVDLTVQVAGSSGAITSPDAPLSLTVRGPRGSLDTTFGDGGVATVPIGALGAESPDGGVPQAPLLAALAVVPDSSDIVFAGHGYARGPGGEDTWPMVLGRLTASGAPDPTFAPTSSTPGILVTLPAGDTSFVPAGQGALHVYSTEQMIVSGYLSTSGGAPALFVASYTSDGTLDPSYGGTGILTLTSPSPSTLPGGFAFGQYPLVASMFTGGAFGPSGPAIAQIYDGPDASDPQSGTSPPIAAYPGASFGPLVDLDSPDMFASLVGASADGGALPLGLVLSQATGAIDTKYGNGGVVVDPGFEGPVVAATTLVGSPLFLVGTGHIANGDGGSTPSIQLSRFIDGLLDPGFGHNGITAPRCACTASSIVIGPIEGPGNTILVGGTVPGNPIGLVSYTSAGIIDQTFGTNGWAGVPAMSGATSVGPTLIDVEVTFPRVVVGTIVTVPGHAGGGVPVVEIARFWD